MSCSNKLALEKYTFKQQQVQATKYDKLSLQVQCPLQAAPQLCLSCFFVDAINWKFLYLFLLASLEQYSTSSWKYTNLFLFFPE